MATPRLSRPHTNSLVLTDMHCSYHATHPGWEEPGYEATPTSSAVGLSAEECFQQSYIRSTMAGKAGSAFPSLMRGRSPLVTAAFSS